MHYKILAAIFCNLLLILLIGLLLIRYGIQDKNEESNCIIIDTSQASMVNEVKYEEYNNIKSYNCKKIEEYTVFCNNIDLENVTNWLNNKYTKKHTIALRLREIKFPNNIITNMTFAKIIPRIRYLKLQSCAIHNITDKSLSYPPLQLDTLVIADVKIKLRKEIFHGLQLKHFHLMFHENYYEFNVENDVFQYIPFLATIQIEYCLSNPEQILNITGKHGFELKNVLTLDFQFNPISALEARSFINIPNVEVINLANSRIETIDVDTFKGLTHLKNLTLHNNYLQTLPNGVFNNILKSIRFLTLHDNLWSCACSLQWLKNLYVDQKFITRQPEVLCFPEPKLPFKMVDFCKSDSSRSIVRRGDPEVNAKTCSRLIDQSTSSPDIKEEDSESVNVNIPREKVKFKFTDGDQGLRIDLSGDDITKSHFMWTNTYDENECVYEEHVKETMFIYDLTRGSTYSFCLLEGDNSTMTPYNCAGHTIPVEWDEDAWLKNKIIIPVISVIVVTLVIIIILSALIVYYCIRKHPRLIKGNKNVVIIKKKHNGQNMDMIGEFDRPVYIAPSAVTYDQGYLTPNYRKYARVKYRPPLLQRISEHNSDSSVENWTFNTPHSSRLENNSRSQMFSEYDEIPPPIPGNHPYNISSSA